MFGRSTVPPLKNHPQELRRKGSILSSQGALFLHACFQAAEQAQKESRLILDYALSKLGELYLSFYQYLFHQCFVT